MAKNHLPAARESMRGSARSFLSSASLSLFLWLFAVVIAAVAVYAFINARTTSQQWHETVKDDALRHSELIRSYIHYGMLLNHGEDVRYIIETVAQSPDVVGVRIYDKQGAIIFSADAEEIGEQVDLQAEACVVCHDRSVPLRSVPTEERARVYRGPDGTRVLGLINPIENKPACYNAGCHAHPPSQTVLGVLDVRMSMAEADTRLAETNRLNVAGAVSLALLVGVASAIFIDQVVRRPVKSLIGGAERVARGDLDFHIQPSSHNEIGQLAQAFNQMTTDLRQAQRENAEWAATLEGKVVEKTEELRRTQSQVIHMEKMASLGKLAATVAHELNNPLAGVLNYAKLIERSLEEETQAPDERQEIQRFLSIIQKETGRCGGIVRNLLLFARGSGAELEPQPLGPIVERALMITHHHLEMAGIELESDLQDEDVEVIWDGGQVQQALVALIVNAVEAMSEGGRLTVESARVDESIELKVSDTGSGIAPEDLSHIFEPFFSTKNGEEGVGLGLAVVYGIVTRHSGTIDVESEVGKGTTFRMRIPRQPAAARQGANRQQAWRHR